MSLIYTRMKNERKSFDDPWIFPLKGSRSFLFVHARGKSSQETHTRCAERGVIHAGPSCAHPFEIETSTL